MIDIQCPVFRLYLPVVLKEESGAGGLDVHFSRVRGWWEGEMEGERALFVVYAALQTSIMTTSHH